MIKYFLCTYLSLFSLLLLSQVTIKYPKDGVLLNELNPTVQVLKDGKKIPNKNYSFFIENVKYNNAKGLNLKNIPKFSRKIIKLRVYIVAP